MEVDEDDLLFSSGRRVYAHNACISLNLVDRDEPGESPFALGYGADGGLVTFDDWFDPENALSAQDCVELADAMIERWQRFRERYVRLHSPGADRLGNFNASSRDSDLA